jgi:hypothetical protein
MTSFTYIDRRFGMTYTVFHEHGNFLGAHGYVDRIGADPIVYETLSSLPSGPRHEIENRLCQLSHTQPS